MEQKFIKLTNRTEEYYVNPYMITTIKKSKDNDHVTVYLFDERSIRPDETLQEIMKMINDSSKFKFSF